YATYCGAKRTEVSQKDCAPSELVVHRRASERTRRISVSYGCGMWTTTFTLAAEGADSAPLPAASGSFGGAGLPAPAEDVALPAFDGFTSFESDEAPVDPVLAGAPVCACCACCPSDVPVRP